MRYSWIFCVDWLDNMAGLQMFQLKEKDDVSVTHMKQTGTVQLRRDIHRVPVYELSSSIAL